MACEIIKLLIMIRRLLSRDLNDELEDRIVAGNQGPIELREKIHKKIIENRIESDMVSTYVSEQSELMSKVMDDDEIDRLLVTVDTRTKQKIYTKLVNDYNEDIINNLTMVQKIEILVILMVRLFFVFIKHLVPLTQKVYHKFVDNQYFLFNNLNFNRVLNLFIKFMNNVEKTGFDEVEVSELTPNAWTLVNNYYNGDFFTAAQDMMNHW